MSRKVTATLLDVCLSDYFAGCARPTVIASVHSASTAEEIGDTIDVCSLWDDDHLPADITADDVRAAVREECLAYGVERMTMYINPVEEGADDMCDVIAYFAIAIDETDGAA